MMTSQPGGGRLEDAIDYLMPFLMQCNQFLGELLAVSFFKIENHQHDLQLLRVSRMRQKSLSVIYGCCAHP